MGTGQSILLAIVEINLLNLKHFIENEINCWDRICLTCAIDNVAEFQEIAIFKASMDYDFDCTLSCVQGKLDLANEKLKSLLNDGKISQDLANDILLKIEQTQNDIDVVKNSL